jgi:hypothetical protein
MNKEILIPMSRYRRNITSIIRRNENVVHKITRNGEPVLVHMPKDMYDGKCAELEAESKRRYG